MTDKYYAELVKFFTETIEDAPSFKALQEENERLRVCGTCGHMNSPTGNPGLRLNCDIGYGFVSPTDPCGWSPSTWKPYWTNGNDD